MTIMKAFTYCLMTSNYVRYGAQQSKTDLDKTKCLLNLLLHFFETLPNYNHIQLLLITCCHKKSDIHMNIIVHNLTIFLFRGRRFVGGRRTESLSTLSSEELMKRAARIMTIQRKRRSTPDMEILIPRTEPNPWRSTGPLAKENLMSKYTGRRPVMGQGTDSDCMTRYLAKVNQSGAQIPESIRYEEFLPAGAPLLDFLAVSMDRIETWKLPPRDEISFYQRARGLSTSMLDNVKVDEIIVGQSRAGQIERSMEIFWENWGKDQRMLPTQTVSMDNEEIQITLYDVYRLAGKIRCEFPILSSEDVDKVTRYPGVPEDRWVQLPVRIMLGNGLSWALMITINLEVNSQGRYILEKKIKVQDMLLDFLEEIPICTGLGVRTDATDVEFYYTLFSDRKIKLKGFIDLTSLSVLCGYNMRSMSMTPMGVNVVGHTLNKCASTGDGKWSLRWRMIPDPLKIYALGDLMFGHIAYSVLSSILIRDVFPDPDIVNRCLNVSDHWFSIAWVLELIAFSLDGVEVHNVDFDSARSRSEMIRSLRFRYSESSTLMERSPARIELWCDLLGGWPALTSGGCRFIYQARERFLSQVKILKKSGFKWVLDVRMKDMGERFESYSRFGIHKDKLDACNYTDPAPFQYGMFRPRSLKVPAIRFDPEKVKTFKIGKFCKTQTRGVKAVIFEWARLNPNKIRDFLSRLSTDPSFCKFYYGVYQGLRLIFKRLFNTEAMRIPDLDKKFLLNIKENLKKEEELKRKSWELFQSREIRCKHLQSVLKSTDQEDQTLCLENIPKLPEWVSRRKGRKRNRSRSRSRSKSRSSRKKSRTDATSQERKDDYTKESMEQEVIVEGNERAQVPIEQEVVVEDNCEDVVIIDLEEEEDDVEIPGINDPKPEAKKVMPEKRKKKKGKKGKKVPGKAPTYDEMIEAREVHDTDDEYGLECHFSEQLF